MDQVSGFVANRISYKKTKRGKIRKLVKEIYLRDDISCGFYSCQVCEISDSAMPLPTEGLLIPCDRVFACQQDFLFDDPVFAEEGGVDLGLVICYSAMKGGYDGRVNKRVSERRNFHVLPNEFIRELFVPFPKIETPETLSSRAFEAVIKAAVWLKSHLGDEVNIRILTDTEDRVSLAHNSGITAVTVDKFVEGHREIFPLTGEKLAIQTPIADSTEAAYYPPHLAEGDCTDGLCSGRYFQGTLRMAMGTCQRGVVGDVEIVGREALNRALDGDVVIVERIDMSDHSQSCEAIYQEGEEEVKTASTEIMNRMSSSEASTKLSQARIVGIVRRNIREICGTLRPLADGSSEQHRLFIPADARYPYIRLNTRASAELEGMRIVVVIDTWDRFSRNPSGHWIKVLGKAGDRNTESAVILHEHDVITREFSDSVLRCLPPSDFVPSAEEIAKRKDLRKVIVCSIDPPGCKDIDDALSCEILPNGNYRVGVHIADVTHFVLPGSAIDKEAALRCTTVYLVEKRTDMLPSLLTTDLCSLRHSVDRLAFSVLWEMKPDTCEIVHTEYAKSIIHSCASLTYADAQSKIEDPHDKSELAASIRRLNQVAKVIRSKRMGKGALELASQEVRFELDSETMDPTNVTAYQTKETNKLVEEFMLLANQAVAEQILRNFPSTSVLRRHPPPKDASLQKLKKLLAQHGVNDFTYETNRELADSLNKAARLNDPYFNKLIRIMTTRTMNQAVYFCTGECDPGLFYHYGLAMELYTHFTSPIRRYADVMAHRLLAASLGLTTLPEELAEKKKVADQCDVINYKHRNAQFAGRASTDLHTFLFFRAKGEMEADAVVAGIRRTGRGEPSLSVTVPRFGVEGLVHLDEEKWSINEEETVLSFKGNDTTFSIGVFDHVIVRIRTEDKDFRYRTCFEILRKSHVSEQDDADTAETLRKRVEAEMFPDRIEERPDRI